MDNHDHPSFGFDLTSQRRPLQLLKLCRHTNGHHTHPQDSTKAVEPIIAVPSTELAIRRDQVRHCTQDRHFAVSHNPSPFSMTISVLHRPISSVEEDNPRRNAFERMLLFALFMKREKEEKKRERSFRAERVLCSGLGGWSVLGQVIWKTIGDVQCIIM
jgi:hypothetical protein